MQAEGRGGFITLGRDSRLTAAKWAGLTAALQKFDRDREIYGVILEASGADFSTGRDESEFHAAIESGPEAMQAKLGAEANGIWRIDRSPKPFVSLVRGRAEGAGLGLALHGTHKVAGETARFAVADFHQGRMIGSGLSFLLSRLPGGLGHYLLLTGLPIVPALAREAGLVTHVIGEQNFPAIRAAMAAADPIDPVLDGLDDPSGAGDAKAALSRIDGWFADGGPDAILARLKAERGAHAAAARAAAAAITALPPRLATLAHRLMTVGRPKSLRAALELEICLADRIAFYPPELRFDSCFAPRGRKFLDLPPDPAPPSID